MNADHFASRVIERLNTKTEYPDVYAWREAWWRLWLKQFREHRAEWEVKISAVRSEIAEYERRLAAGNEISTVIPSLEWHIRIERPKVEFWELLTVFLDTQAKPAKQAAAARLAQFSEANVGGFYWELLFFDSRNYEPSAYEQLHEADHWGADTDERNAGAFYARMQRIARTGSADPLDSEEARWMLLVEWRYMWRCRAARYGRYSKRDYAATQHCLHAQKWIARINAYEQLRDAEQIGDTAGKETAERMFEAAGEMFGGNINEHGAIIWANQLSDEQRALWERWKADHGDLYEAR